MTDTKTEPKQGFSKEAVIAVAQAEEESGIVDQTSVGEAAALATGPDPVRLFEAETSEASKINGE